MTSPVAAKRASIHGRRRRWGRTDRVGVAVLMAVSAVGVGFADAAPTGLRWVDLLYRLAIGAMFPLLMTSARRWTWLLAGVVTAVACPLPESLLGFGALAGAIVGVTNPKRSPWLGAAVGAFTAQGLFRMSWPEHFGFTAIIGVALTTCVVGSSYRTVRSSARRIIRRVALGVALLIAVASAVTLVTVLSARDQLERSVRTASDGLSAAQDGKQADAVRLLGGAKVDFDEATNQLDGWWMQPSRLLPIVSQHLDAATTLTADGRDLVDAANAVATAVDIPRLRNAEGDVDLDLLRSFTAPLNRSARAVTAAQSDIDAVRSPWLLSAIESKLDEFNTKLNDVAPGIRNTADAAKLLPGLLGADGDRRYFLMLLTPSEARDLGGHMGNWAELTVSKGKFDVSRSGRTALLKPEGVAGRTLDDPTSYPRAYVDTRPAIFPQNWGASPDLPTVARAVADLYPKSGGSKIDGVAVVDPYGFAALLKLTGPYTAPGAPTLDANNAADFLLRQQYFAFPDETARSDFLDGLIKTTISKLRTGGQSSPRELVDALNPAVRASQLRFITFDPKESTFLTRIGLNRPVRRPTSGDQLAVITTNLGPNKMDAYVSRVVDVGVKIDPDTGALRQTVTVTLQNTGPTSGPIDVVNNIQGLAKGTAIDRISLLTPLSLDSVTVNGKAASAGPAPEFGLNRYGVPVATAPGATTVITFELSGRTSGSTYRLSMLRQPLSSSDQVTVNVASTSGAKWSGRLERPAMKGKGAITLDLDADALFTFDRP